MSENENRRDFLKKVAIGGVAAGAGLIGAPNILAQKATPKPKASKPKTSDSKTSETKTGSSASSGPKLRIAVIGCGGQGTGAHVPPAAREQLVALVDVDDKNLEKALKKAKDINPSLDTSKVQTFNDYRKMFDKVGKEIDAVLIATPNHHHCIPALMAMQLGKGAYVEKPMAYCIQEAHRMAEYSRKYKVATQMGNQGHSNEGYRRLCEYIWAGAIGKVTEVFCWTNRANGGVGDRPPTLPVPPGMHWDEWIGPAPFREYHKDLHPHEWHGWHDFGNGSLGNMACHVMDGAHWALKLGHPTSIELEEVNGGTKERYPIGARIRWDFPARGDMPPVKVYWYDGKRPGTKSTEEGDTKGSVGSSAMNRPPLLAELMKKYNRKFSESGSLYVGDKGIMYSGTYGESTQMLPDEAQKAFPKPAELIPRIKNGHHGNFFNAVRGGEPACSNFEVAAKLTEMLLLGCLAMKAGLHKKLEWDGENTKCTNMPEINQYIARQYRQGWQV